MIRKIEATHEDTGEPVVAYVIPDGYVCVLVPEEGTAAAMTPDSHVHHSGLSAIRATIGVGTSLRQSPLPREVVCAPRSGPPRSHGRGA